MIGPCDTLLTHWTSPRLTPEVLAAAPRLRLVVHGGGSVRFLVDRAAIEAGLVVTTAGYQFAHAVAECTLAMTLMARRHLHRFTVDMHAPDRTWPGIDDYGTPQDLSTARVGIIGLGQISRLLIPMLRGIAGEIVVYARTRRDDAAAELGFRYAEFDELIATSDVIIVLAASTPETRQMVGAEQFAAMKAGALFVNPGRAWLVDQAAQLEAFRSGRIAGALDVYEAEPLAAHDPLRELPNVVLLPHIAGATAQSRLLGGALVVEELERFTRGRAPRFPVTTANYDHLA